MKSVSIIPKRDNIEESLRLSNEYGANFEYNDFFLPFVLDDDMSPDPGKPVYYSATFYDGKWNISEPICTAGEFLAKNILDGSQTYLGGMAYYYGVGEAGIHPNHREGTTFETNRIYIARFDF